MNKRLLLGVATGVLMITGAQGANATLTTIGTATYNGSEYKLIWDDDNNGNSVVWLDYTNSGYWSDQNSWVTTLDSFLTMNLQQGYSVDWGTNPWRLAAVNEADALADMTKWGTGAKSGYNLTSSEFGHLYYEELGNKGYYDVSGNLAGSPNYGLNNTGDFDNLLSVSYWTATPYNGPKNASYSAHWEFSAYIGRTLGGYDAYSADSGLALRTGSVEFQPPPPGSPSPVPEPTTMLLFGTGLASLAGNRIRKRRGNRSL